MESITGECRFLRAVRRFAVAGVVLAGLSGCAASSTSTDSYELVLNAPGLESAQPKVVVVHDDYSQTVERSTWNTNQATWPKADLIFWRIKDNFRGQQVYGYESSLPELIKAFLPGENISLGAGSRSENVLGALDYHRFRRGPYSECIFVRQGVSRFSDQVEVIGSGEALGDMVIRGWYCVGPTEPDQEAAFQGFIDGIGIQGWALP